MLYLTERTSEWRLREQKRAKSTSWRWRWRSEMRVAVLWENARLYEEMGTALKLYRLKHNRL